MTLKSKRRPRSRRRRALTNAPGFKAKTAPLVALLCNVLTSAVTPTTPLRSHPPTRRAQRSHAAATAPRSWGSHHRARGRNARVDRGALADDRPHARRWQLGAAAVFLRPRQGPRCCRSTRRANAAACRRAHVGRGIGALAAERTHDRRPHLRAHYRTRAFPRPRQAPRRRSEIRRATTPPLVDAPKSAVTWVPSPPPLLPNEVVSAPNPTLLPLHPKDDDCCAEARIQAASGHAESFSFGPRDKRASCEPRQSFQSLASFSRTLSSASKASEPSANLR